LISYRLWHISAEQERSAGMIGAAREVGDRLPPNFQDGNTFVRTHGQDALYWRLL
jgi:hypothetical protein